MLPARLLAARAFHMMLWPRDVTAQTRELLDLRRQAGVVERPLLVWEPVPRHCHKLLQQHLKACRLVDVFSPNHVELFDLFGLFGKQSERPLDKGAVESCAGKLLDAMTAAGPLSHHPRTIVVRAAEYGSFVASMQQSLWLPPVYPHEIGDAVGAGSAFLGAFAIALERSGDVGRACAHGHVAASFALEQIGFPTLRRDGEKEVCNYKSFAGRLADVYSVA